MMFYILQTKPANILRKIKNVMVVGGGIIAHYLAMNLKLNDIKVKIIEINKRDVMS